MILNFLEADPIFWIRFKHILNQVFALRAQWNFSRKLKFVLLYSAVCVIDSICFKRRFSYNQSVKNDTYSPNINLKRMASFIQYLRCNVIRSSTCCKPSLSGAFYFCRKPKISDFHFHLVVQKNISQLYVSVKDVVFVKVLNSANDLQKIAFGFEFSNSDSVFDKLWRWGEYYIWDCCFGRVPK